jgi:curli biogenesis system outer membrane secretion channel CsgG
MRNHASALLFIAALLGAMLGAAGPAPAGDDPGIKFRIIVGEFEDKAEHGWYHGAGPGAGMADMLITALVKTGKFRVFERAALDELLAEKDLSMSDLANPGVAAQQKFEIGDILVKATITEFGYKESKVGGALKKFGSSAGVGSYSGRVAVDMRLIDIGSSEVIWADSVNKSETSNSISLSTSEFSFGDVDKFDDHVVGKATRKVIDEVVKKLEKETKNRPWQGLMITADEYLFIDGGTELGIKSGMTFEVLRPGKVVKHPKTGKVLKVIHETLGVVTATEVEEGVTTVVAVEGAGFATGDVVKLRK